MEYYIFIQDNKINGCGQCRQLTDGVINYKVSAGVFNSFIETPEKYFWDGENIVENPEWYNIQLEKAKVVKIGENDKARDEKLFGGVEYKGIKFDSDTDQKINLLAIVSTMSDEDTVTWFGMDNEPLECDKEDLMNIGGLITQLHSYCWHKNAEIKLLISEAQTLEELENIEINYEESEETT